MTEHGIYAAGLKDVVFSDDIELCGEEEGAKNEEFIRTVTLADSVSYDAPAGTSKDWNINGEKLTLSIA